MEATRTILTARFNQFGFKKPHINIVEVNGQSGIQIELRHFAGDEQWVVNTLLEVGKLEFWDTGPHGLLTPATNFRANDYTRYNPGNLPLFTSADLNPQAFSVVRDPQTESYDINFGMRGDATNRFRRYTVGAIGHALTVTLDGKVLDSAIINGDITGLNIISEVGVISGSFTQQQADALVSLLSFAELPFELKQSA
jgi:preprotein translocase subunit SecD